MSIPSISVIVASTRTARFADYPLAWIARRMAERTDLTFEVLDLREHPLPFFDRAASPVWTPRDYASPEEAELGRILDAADGYLVLTNEYNHGYSSALKNTLDHFFIEFRHKPMAFVGYGNVGGARAVEQLRLVAAELNMVSVRTSAHIFSQEAREIRQHPETAETVLAAHDTRLDQVFDDLVWWADALSAARAKDDALAS